MVMFVEVMELVPQANAILTAASLALCGLFLITDLDTFFQILVLYFISL